MSKPSRFYRELASRFPDVTRAYEALGDATRAAGPLDAGTAELVKLALAAGGRLESGVRAHVRRALEQGVTPDRIRHVPLLAITTLGFPAAMALRGVVEAELEKRLGSGGPA